MAEKIPNSLSSKLEGKYKMATGYQAGVYVHGNVQVDTRSCSVAEAEMLINAGSEVLVKDVSVKTAEKK